MWTWFGHPLPLSIARLTGVSGVPGPFAHIGPLRAPFGLYPTVGGRFQRFTPIRSLSDWAVLRGWGRGAAHGWRGFQVLGAFLDGSGRGPIKRAEKVRAGGVLRGCAGCGPGCSGGAPGVRSGCAVRRGGLHCSGAGVDAPWIRSDGAGVDAAQSRTGEARPVCSCVRVCALRARYVRAGVPVLSGGGIELFFHFYFVERKFYLSLHCSTNKHHKQNGLYRLPSRSRPRRNRRGASRFRLFRYVRSTART